jgi:hypothetical protein
LDAIARLAGAILIAFAGMTVVKSRRKMPLAWLARWSVGLPLFAAALWIVLATIPHPRDSGMPTFSIVASAVLIAGLAVEELIGSEVRRLLGI